MIQFQEMSLWVIAGIHVIDMKIERVGDPYARGPHPPKRVPGKQKAGASDSLGRSEAGAASRAPRSRYGLSLRVSGLQLILAETTNDLRGGGEVTDARYRFSEKRDGWLNGESRKVERKDKGRVREVASC